MPTKITTLKIATLSFQPPVHERLQAYLDKAPTDVAFKAPELAIALNCTIGQVWSSKNHVKAAYFISVAAHSVVWGHPKAISAIRSRMAKEKNAN